MSTATETQSISRTRKTKPGGPEKNVGKEIEETEHGPEDKFFWTYTEEPHRTRRQAIIKAHKDILQLCGPEPLTKYVVVSVGSLQIFCAWLLKDTPILSWPFFLTAYIVGATANQNLFLAIHEISHN